MEGDAASPSSSSSPRSKRRKIHASSEGILHDLVTGVSEEEETRSEEDFHELVHGGDSDSSQQSRRISRSDYKIVKRSLVHKMTDKTIFFIRSTSCFVGTLKRMFSLLCEQGHTRIELHGMGDAMERVTDLALAFQDLDGVGDVILDPKTSSQLTYDDYIPRRPGLVPFSVPRYIASLSIVVRRKPSFLELLEKKMERKEVSRASVVAQQGSSVSSRIRHHQKERPRLHRSKSKSTVL